MNMKKNTKIQILSLEKITIKELQFGEYFHYGDNDVFMKVNSCRYNILHVASGHLYVRGEDYTVYKFNQPLLTLKI